MKQLPKVRDARINAGKNTIGSFIDPEWVLHYIASGTWEFQIGSRLYSVRPGDMILLAPRRLHLVRALTGKNLVHYVVHFDLNDTSMRDRDLAPVITLPKEDRTEILNLNRLLRQEWKFGLGEVEIITSGYLTAMLGIYFRHMSTAKRFIQAKEPHWPNIEEAIGFIQTHYADRSLNLGKISQAANLSANYFCAIFKAGTGFSIKKYLLAYRLEKAEELLIHSRLNCSQIAEAVGFTSIHHLSRAFRKNKKTSPTAYRILYGSR